MDIISDVLKKISLSSTFYFKSDFSSPWGMDIPAGPFAQFHMIVDGNCVLSTNTGKYPLKPGDIVVFPHGTAHWLADKAGHKKVNGKDVVAAIASGNSPFKEGPFGTSLICGHFEFNQDLDHPFLYQLPEIIHITRHDLKELPWMQSIANLIINEMANQKDGTELIQQKLGEVLFIQTIRVYMQKQVNNKGFLAAIQDQKIGKAIKAIHQSPEQNWQLSSLARIAGMSRTSFSNNFKSLMGQTVLSYLTHWRISEAKFLLQQSDKHVGEIAEAVGYRSEAAFNRIFKKKMAITPFKYRKAFLSS